MRILERVPFSGELRCTVVRGRLSKADERAILDDRLGPSLRKRIRSQTTWANLVTNTGRSDIVSRIINGNTTAIPGWIAITLTAIVPAATDTTLAGETNRKAVSTSAVFSTYYQRYAATFTSTDIGAATIAGAGLFTAAAAGNMWAIVSTSVVKAATDSLVVEWRINTVSS